MQTTFIVDSPFQEINQNVHPLSLPQIRDRVDNDRVGSRREAGCLSFGKRSKDRGLISPGQKIEESIAYMNQNLNRPLQVSTLAALVNVSPSHYFALFKKYTGRAPIDYFTRLRMAEARRLLNTTASSVKEVAGVLGYNDPFYFSRVFKSVNQLAPSNYRARQKSQIATAQRNLPQSGTFAS